MKRQQQMAFNTGRINKIDNIREARRDVQSEYVAAHQADRNENLPLLDPQGGTFNASKPFRINTRLDEPMSHLTTHDREDVLRKTVGASRTFQFTSILPFDPTRCLKISHLKNGWIGKPLGC